MISAEDFWQWFDENKERYYSLENLFNHDLYRELQVKVREYHPELSFQIGGVEDDPIRQLTISANGKIENFEKVEELVCQAPIFDKWKIIAFKPADGFDIKIRIGEIEFDPKKLKYVPIELMEYPDVGAIRVYMPEYQEEQRDLFQIGISALLEACLGEKCAALQINYIDVKSEPQTDQEIQMVDEFVHLEKYLEYRQNQIKYN